MTSQEKRFFQNFILSNGLNPTTATRRINTLLQ